MRHVLAIAARELRERYLLFPAAFVLGCLPLVVPAFGVRPDMAQALGIGFSVLMGAAAAVVVGSTMLARDVGTGRLGFLFSRPVSWPAIWGGKWVAALVLVLGAGLLAAVPWMALSPPSPRGVPWLVALADREGSVLVLALAVLVVGLANFNSTLFRSRSPWLVFDLAALLACLWAVRRWVAPLAWYGYTESPWAPHAAAALAACALLVGSAAQVAVGRTDVRRAHRALSIGVWAILATVLAASAGVVLWVRAAGPADVRALAVARDPGGHWAFVEGPARVRGFYPSSFLIDTATGRYFRVPEARNPLLPVAHGALFSADGRFAALPREDAEGRGAAVWLFDLSAARPRPRLVSLQNSPPLETWRNSLALSPSGAHVFLAHGSGASLYELPSGRRVATTTVPPGFWPADARFTGERSARAWLIPASASGGTPLAEMRVVDLALDGAAHTRAFATAERLDGWGALVADARGDRIVTLDGGLRLRDGADGRLIATLVEGAGGEVARRGRLIAATFLSDGRIVTADGTPREGTAEPRLAVFDAAGTRLGGTPVEMPSAALSFGPELEPGRVVVSSFRTVAVLDDSVVFDANESRLRDTLPGLRPAPGFFTVAAVPPGAQPSPVQLFRDERGRVLRVDTKTGERTIVAGPGARRGERLDW